MSINDVLIKRINNIGVRQQGRKYEIVKWFKNQYYNKEDEYYQSEEDPEYYLAEGQGFWFHESIFRGKEHCIVLAIFRDNDDILERSIELTHHMLNLDLEDYEDFKKIIKDLTDYANGEYDSESEKPNELRDLDRYQNVKQHRGQLKHLGNKQRSWIKKNYPDIDENDMVEIVEYIEYDLYNTWVVDGLVEQDEELEKK